MAGIGNIKNTKKKSLEIPRTKKKSLLYLHAHTCIYISENRLVIYNLN